MTTPYERAKAELDETRAAIEEVFQMILDAAEEKHPGITEDLHRLNTKEELLRGIAVKTWVDTV